MDTFPFISTSLYRYYQKYAPVLIFVTVFKSIVTFKSSIFVLQEEIINEQSKSQ